MSNGEKGKGKKYNCEHCGEDFHSGIELYNHIKKAHPEAHAEKKETKEKEVRLAGVPEEELSQKTLALAEAIEAAAPDLNPKTKKQMLLAYDDDESALGKNPDALAQFLDDYGLRRRQQRQIVRQLFGTQQQPTLTGFPGMNFQTMPTPWGPMPAIIINKEGSGPQPFPWPLPQERGESAEQVRQQTKLEDRLDRLEQVLSNLIESKSQPPPVTKRSRRVVFDKEGNITTDANGNIVYDEYEEPWEPGARESVLDNILPLLIKQMLGDRPRPIDEEALALKIKDRLSSDLPGKSSISTDTIKEAIRSEISDIKHDVDEIRKEQTRRERDEEIDRAIQRVREQDNQIISSLQAQVNERAGIHGLSDTQAAMKYQKDLVDIMVTTVSEQVNSVREDLRPLILQQAVQSLKMQGIPDDTIAQFLGSVRQRIPAVATVAEGAKQAALEKIKAWSKS